MSVVAPAVYVGTWHKYNCGSIAGRWFDLTTFDDERDFFAACRALHQDEADPELMFQDYEGFPVNMASECHINWAWVEGFRQARDEGCEEAYRHTAQNQPAETVRAAAAATGRFAVAFPVRVAPGSGCFMKTNAPRLFFVDKEAGVSFDVFHVLSVSFPVTACATHDGGM